MDLGEGSPLGQPQVPAVSPNIPPAALAAVAKRGNDEVADEKERTRIRRVKRVLRLTAVSAILVGTILAALIYPMPSPARTYVAVSAVAAALILSGMLFLIVLIPLAAAKSDVRTELYSVRAAYLCVVTGLILLAAVGVGAIFARVMVTVGR